VRHHHFIEVLFGGVENDFGRRTVGADFWLGQFYTRSKTIFSGG
jgi:hypothetical protein